MNKIVELVTKRHNGFFQKDTIAAPVGYGVDYAVPSGDQLMQVTPNAAQEPKRKYVIPFVITTLLDDRDGDTVVPLGCQFKNYALNPVVFFGHQKWEVPIGKSTNENGQLCVYQSKDRILADCYFDEHDEDSMFIYGKVERGYLSAASIAFVPIRAYQKTAKQKAGSFYGDRNRNEIADVLPTGWVFEEVDVTEWSIVGVQSNPGAIRDALTQDKSYITPKLQKALEPFAAIPKKFANGWTPEKPMICKDGVCQVVKRWNEDLSDEFDISAEELPPSRTIYDWATKYLKCEIKHIHQTSVAWPSVQMGNNLTGLKYALSNYHCMDTRNIEGEYTRGEESPPVYETIQLNSKMVDTFLIKGVQFFDKQRSKIEKNLDTVVRKRFLLQVRPDYDGIYLTLYMHQQNVKELGNIFEVAEEWGRNNNFLKNEAFSLSGKFIENTGETWKDVFLDQKNKDVLSNTSKQFNDKGKNFVNRGMIATGPPGTGKTLSGRVLRNSCKGTFIWVSARDLWHRGSFGSFKYAYSLAKELAPTVLFIEDIDNWMDEYTVDLIKTEMDGIEKSQAVWTILTTNYPERMPEALIDRPGRFHDILVFDYPKEQERREMLQKWLTGSFDEDAVIERTKGYSGAHMYELCQYAKNLQEQDSLGIDDALTQALNKIEEQKELITQFHIRDRYYKESSYYKKETEMSTKSCQCEGKMKTKKMDSTSGSSGGYAGKEEDKKKPAKKEEKPTKEKEVMEDEEQEEIETEETEISEKPDPTTSDDVPDDIDSEEDVNEEIEAVEQHVNEAEQALADGDIPLGAQLLANASEHLQSLLDYLGEASVLLEQPDVKDYLANMQNEVSGKLQDINKIGGQQYPNLRDMFGEAAQVQSDPEMEIEEEEIEERQEENEEEEPMIEEPEEDQQQDTQELLQQYRQTNKGGKKIIKKSIKKSVITKACDNMRDASEHLKGLIKEDDIPKKYKAGLSFYAKQLDDDAMEMEKGFEGGSENVEDEVQKELDAETVKEFEELKKAFQKATGR